MVTAWLIGVCLQCALLFAALRGGRLLLRPGDFEPAWPALPERPPRAGMIVPAAGARPDMEPALRSLLTQDYPDYEVVFVTAEENDPAVPLLRRLTEEDPRARHVVAGRAGRCGQKNHNTLHGLAALGPEVEIFAFCDSTHIARPDFLRMLLRPLLAGEAAFSTGYHTVEAQDAQPVTLAYQMTVVFMRLLQAVSAFTQPWGGAMAMTRAAFERYGVEKLWASNVVDDCSLAGLLMASRGQVRLCPEALLCTRAARHSRAQWQSWFERQLLFLKFCTPAMWHALGLGLFVLFAPTLASLCLVPACLFGAGPAILALPALGHLVFFFFFALKLRDFTEKPAPALPWLNAFVLNLGMLGRVYAGCVRKRILVWHDTKYVVGRGGRVESLTRIRRL